MVVWVILCTGFLHILPLSLWNMMDASHLATAAKEIMNCQETGDRKKLAKNLKLAATAFLNNESKHRRMYFGYRMVELMSMGIHCLSFFCLFYCLDERFIWIGKEYFTDRAKVDSIFHDAADCLAGQYYKSLDTWKTVRMACELYMNPFYERALVALWITYVVGALGHLIYLAIQIFAIIFCLEKR